MSRTNLLARSTSSLARIETLERRTLLSGGAPDPSFGLDGLVQTDMWSEDAVYSVAVQSDNKILAAGNWGMTRYNADGSLDTSFDGDGKVPLNGSLFFYYREVNLALQVDGKILRAGSVSGSTGSDFSLVRLNPNGSLDTSFGNGGRVTTDFLGNNDYANALIVQSDGKIVVGGTAEKPSAKYWEQFDLDFALARYNADGTLDETFGTGGKVTTLFPPSHPLYSSWDRINDLLVQVVDGEERIVAVGEANDDFALARYRADGSLDPTFGIGGQMTTNLRHRACLTCDDSYDEAHAVALQSHPTLGERIVVVGDTRLSGEYQAAVAAYTADGVLDATFGAAGAVTTDLSEQGHDLAVQEDGKIVIVGSRGKNNGDDFAVVRLNANGALDDGSSADTTPEDHFGTGGLVTTDFPDTDPFLTDSQEAHAVTIQPDGKILVAGESEGNFALARYFADEPPIAFSIDDVSVTEGNAGTGSAVFTVSLSVPSTQTLTVDYFTGPAGYPRPDGSDYTAVSGTLTFNPGETSKTISVPIAGETMYEPDETFVVKLRNSRVAALADAQGLGTIINDDTRPRLSISDVSSKETHNRKTAFTFTLSLTNASSELISLNYRTVNGTATAGSDYDTASGTLWFHAGETSKTITVWVIGDKLKESDETFFLDLWGAENVDVDDNRGVGTILNDDR